MAETETSAESLREAILWERGADGAVHCHLCAHHCTLSEGRWGLCGVRVVRDGVLQTAVYARAVAFHDDPIEKKPLFHFYPGTRSLSVATVGCNFRCTFCQNWSISQVRRQGDTGREIPPEAVVRVAGETGCRTIAFTYTEPTVYFEYALDTATLARQAGVDTVFVTNGFLSPQALERVAPVLGAANVDLKAFSDRTYRDVAGGRLEPVLDTLRNMKRLGVWVEVTTLVVPQLNDSREELADIAGFIAEELGPETPWHVSRFHPDHEMRDRTATPLASMRRAIDAGRAAGLQHVFAGNVPGDPTESTFCPSCRETLIERRGYAILANHLLDGARCPSCGHELAGRFSGEPRRR